MDTSKSAFSDFDAFLLPQSDISNDPWKSSPTPTPVRAQQQPDPFYSQNGAPPPLPSRPSVQSPMPPAQTSLMSGFDDEDIFSSLDPLNQINRKPQSAVQPTSARPAFGGTALSPPPPAAARRRGGPGASLVGEVPSFTGEYVVHHNLQVETEGAPSNASKIVTLMNSNLSILGRTKSLFVSYRWTHSQSSCSPSSSAKVFRSFYW